MTRFQHTILWIAISAALLSVQGFSPAFGPQVRSVAQVESTTELWGKGSKKKKKKNKKKNGGGAATAVLEPPAVVEEAPPVVVEEPVAVIAEQQVPVAEGELEDPAIKMVANEMFHRKLLAQKLAYDALVAESASVLEPVEEPTVSEPVAEIAEPEPEPQPEPEPEPVDLAAKYAAIDDVGERAYQILKDLGMFDRKD